jgi:ABC-type nitrate/sulfonate/bicarbonate transport system permease component
MSTGQPDVMTPPVDAVGQAAPESAARTPLAARLYRRRFTALSTLSVLLVLGLWQLLASTGVINKTLAGSPWGIVQAFRQLANNGLGGDVLASAKLFAVGLLIAIGIGVVAGVAIGWSSILGALFEPWIAILYAMPIIALLPLIILWFGLGFEAQLIMVLLISVFPVLVGVLTGVRNVDPDLVELARSFRGKDRDVLRTVVLPSVIPYFVAGVRLSIGGALIGVVVAEYFLGNKGIGGLIVTAGNLVQPNEVFVGVVILAVSAVIMTSLLRYGERKLQRWREP